MNPTPSPLRRFIATAMATIMATASTIVPAQTIPRQPTADSTHTYRNWGTPKNKAEVCNAGFVLSGGVCVALNTGSGATLLSGTMPAGNYTNHAPFSLFLAVTPPEQCYNFGIYVRGELAAWVNDACESSKTSVSVVVPPYSSFSFGAGHAIVTALANGVSWAPTQINFDYLISQYFVKNEAVLYSKNQYDEQEPCAWNGDYFLTYKNNQTGKENIVKRSGTFGACSF